jgi:anti-anti-sigma factor
MSDGFVTSERDLKIDIEGSSEAPVMDLAGRLDVNTSPEFRRAALRLFGKGRCKKLVVNFSHCSYIDTSGLATLLDTLAIAREHHARLILSGLNEQVRYMIEINCLSRFLRSEDTESEKLRA